MAKITLKLVVSRKNPTPEGVVIRKNLTMTVVVIGRTITRTVVVITGVKVAVIRKNLTWG